MLKEFALEIQYRIDDTYPKVLREYWGVDVVSNFYNWFLKSQEKAQQVGVKYITLSFNIEDESEILDCASVLEQIEKEAKIKLIIKGTANKNLDAKLLPELIKVLKKPQVIAPIQDDNDEAIVASILDSGIEHKAILRTPIDINLTKELNILSMDRGLKQENIIIDPDTGCIGYGIDYGYSIIERIKEAVRAGDKTLDTPIIVFSGYESYKAKEAKSSDFSTSWGDNLTRSLAWEISTTTALLLAGADIAVSCHPEVPKKLMELFGGTL